MDCPERKRDEDKGSKEIGEAALVEMSYESADALCASGHSPGKEWILDSGCSFHMTPNNAWFEEFEEQECGSVLLGNNKACKIVGLGSIRLKMFNGDEKVLQQVSSQKIYCCHPHETLTLLKLKAELPTNPNPPCSYFYMPSRTINWLNSTNCCNWEGVTCDNATGHVIDLYLFCVQGFITSNSSLFALTHLQRLQLLYNDFQGSSIVPEFGRFKNMTHLDLSHSNFSGDVPLEISHLSKLASLRIGGEIRFSAASIKALSQNLTSLSELELDGIDLASAHFTNFSSLTSLSLSDCKLYGEILDNIFSLPKLQVRKWLYFA